MARKTIITIIALTVGSLHFSTGEHYQGPFPAFVNGYMIDILLPMCMVLLLGLVRARLIQAPAFRAAAVIFVGCVVEASQYLGYQLFGSTFDPLDFLAYGVGVILGLLLDLVFFPHIVPGWNEGT
jgi:hypothetical protein